MFPRVTNSSNLTWFETYLTQVLCWIEVIAYKGKNKP